jgi:hypothetical protein
MTKIGNNLYGYKKEEVSKIPTIKDGCQQRKRIIKIMDAIKFVGLGPLQDQVIQKKKILILSPIQVEH